MLNWIVIWVGSYLFGFGGPLPDDGLGRPAVPSSEDIVEAAKLPVFWGDPLLQGLHVGLFVAVGALVVYSLTSTGRPLATRCGRSASIPTQHATAASASRATTSSRWPSPAFRRPRRRARRPRLAVPARHHVTIQGSTIGFIGIAVALLGRNTAIGVALAALLFAALRREQRLATSIRRLPARSRRRAWRSSSRASSSSSSGADLIVLLALRRLRRNGGLEESRA